ncbi:MAG: hypothetical protein ACOC45_03490 [Alkalispirochaetaceae bacterium]
MGWARRGVALLLVFMLLLSPQVLSQEAGEQEEQEPVPYDPEEFPLWARDLRRGEIIALGSFPVALLLSGIGYRLGRFTGESIRRGEFATEYAPAFVTPEQRAGLSDGEQAGLLITAGAISLTVALIDYLLARRERRGE